VKPIAATRIFDELPPMDEVLARAVTVLGSTGSIGVNTLDVIAHVRKVHGQGAMPITALTAGDNVKVLIDQALAMKPKLAVIGNEELFGELKAGLEGSGIAVAAGRLTTAEADALKARIEASPTALPFVGFGRRHRLGERRGLVSAAVQYLGLSEATLRSDLQSGKSLDAIANAIPGKSAAGLKAAIIAAATSRLDTAVSNGVITSQQEQQRLSQLSSRLDALLARTWTGAGPWLGRDHAGGRGIFEPAGPTA